MSFDPKTAEIKSLKDVSMTFSGIRPRHIVGFSKVVTEDTPKPEVIYRAQRIILPQNATDKDIRRQVKRVIKNLQNTRLHHNRKRKIKSQTLDVENQKILKFDAFKAILSHASQQYDDKYSAYDYRSEYRDKDLHWINSNGDHNQDFRRPLFEINSPTLFVFTTSYPSDWTQRIATESYIYPDTGYDFDPNLKNPIYLVNDKRVMLVFSDFDHGNNPQQMKEHWYNLRFTFKYTDQSEKNVYVMENPPHTFDPGNGSGSGQGFP
ncbi:MAG: hypothetical protein ABJN69_01760 [Hellea sp.]